MSWEGDISAEVADLFAHLEVPELERGMRISTATGMATSKTAEAEVYEDRALYAAHRRATYRESKARAAERDPQATREKWRAAKAAQRARRRAA